MPKSKVSSAAPPRATKGYHHGDLRSALIHTALGMVTEEGAWDFTLREVARRAGVSHMAPYNHFEDKSALLAEVAALGFESLRQTLEAAARGQPRSARQAFGDIAAAYVRFGVEHPSHYRLMFSPELAEKARYPVLEAATAGACAVLTGALERGQASGDARRMARRDQALAAWSLVHGLTTLLIDQRVSFLRVSIGDAEQYTRQAGIALFRGLGAKKA
ncbi:MAG TPA: TetR/AcrR family transcriptional regulator [Gemmatimonadales bacterium]|nr:TetR/AcrR family transcriptional regulator [Gemmatimonadales bacterium]